MLINSISNSSNALGAGWNQVSDASAAASRADAIQYVQPPPPPPPRSGPLPAKLPDIYDTPVSDDGVATTVSSTLPTLPAADSSGAGADASSSATDSSLVQQVNVTRLHLLTLQSVASTVDAALQETVPPSGAVPARTLLTI
jgi:hypothetical protein